MPRRISSRRSPRTSVASTSERLPGRSCSSRPARSTRSPGSPAPPTTRSCSTSTPASARRLAARLRRFKIRVAAEIEVELADPAQVTDAAHEDARIAAGWPKMGAEIVPGETIPAVTGVTGVAVNFTKGCYPGQELVERMDSRGAESPLSLRVLTIGTDVPAGVAAGDPVVDAVGRSDRHGDERRIGAGAGHDQARPRRRCRTGSRLTVPRVVSSGKRHPARRERR